MMIKQVALPSPEYMQDVITRLQRKRDAERAHKQRPDTRGVGQQRHDVAAELTQAQTRLQQAEAELSSLIADGYEIKAQYPFKEGEGINLVLYKDDPRP